MSAIPLPSASSPIPEWRSLYLTALFETDRSLIATRIRSAEKALVVRERELFAAESAGEEKTIVNNALHSLYALRRCLGLV